MQLLSQDSGSLIRKDQCRLQCQLWHNLIIESFTMTLFVVTRIVSESWLPIGFYHGNLDDIEDTQRRLTNGTTRSHGLSLSLGSAAFFRA